MNQLLHPCVLYKANKCWELCFNQANAFDSLFVTFWMFLCSMPLQLNQLFDSGEILQLLINVHAHHQFTKVETSLCSAYTFISNCCSMPWQDLTRTRNACQKNSHSCTMILVIGSLWNTQQSSSVAWMFCLNFLLFLQCTRYRALFICTKLTFGL